MIPYLDLKDITDSFHGAIEEAAARVAASGRYLQGPETEAFEKEYAGFIGTAHAVGCANGLDALTLIFRAFIELGDMAPGDEIIVPANTFIASLLSITENGLVPVLVEPDPATMQIDPSRIGEVISPRTKGILLVHLYGKCAYTEEIGELCRKHDLKLVEDNAQAHGCIFRAPDGCERRTGSLGDASGHSFYPGKNLGALGDAGAVTTDSDRLADMVRRLGNYGSDRKYVFPSIGRNSRIDEIQAALLRVKLPRLDADNNRRREIAARYAAEISNPGVRIPAGLVEATDLHDNVFHIFPVLCDDRDAVRTHLSEQGIGTMIHYPIPPHLQDCYRDKSLLKITGTLPITEDIHRRVLSLPCNPAMTDAQVTAVIQALNSAPHNLP